MALMKSPKDQMAMMALKEAADSADSQADNMDTGDEMDQELKCPKCGYTAKEHEFMLPSGQNAKAPSDSADDSGSMQE